MRELHENLLFPRYRPNRRASRAAFCYTIPMSWAARRRFIILLIMGAVAGAFLAVILTATFYKTPSCADNTQNQGETGVDCGGSCPYLCIAQLQPPTVLFTKAVGNGAGRTDIIALVENKNATAAAKNVPYRVQLYGSDRLLVREISGALDLPPGATQPVFIPGAASGTHLIANAFLDIDPSAPRWFTASVDVRTIPSVSGTKRGGTLDSPRIDAVLENRGINPLTHVRAVVLVRDEQGSVVAASQTVVPVIPAGGRATAIFTWRGAFSAAPSSIEVIPTASLPGE